LTLVLILQAHEGYLAPRHLLVLVALLIPPAAAAWLEGERLLRSVQWRGRWANVWPGVTVFALHGAVVVSLALYALRTPNAADAYLRDVARDLQQRDPAVSRHLLLSGASGKRIAFYAGMPWSPWFEDGEKTGALLAERVLAVRPDYFVIETGTGGERVGNDALLSGHASGLLADPRITDALLEISTRSAGGRGEAVKILRFAWDRAAPAATRSTP
jgi:hypothetical protein